VDNRDHHGDCCKSNDMEESMNQVLLFGSARDAVGSSSLNVQAESVRTVREMRSWIQQNYPEHIAIWNTCAIAVNEVFSQDDDPIHSGDTVAIIPPVSGG
jgi:sulfur-carrier protein